MRGIKQAINLGINRMRCALMNEDGISVIEMILVLVVIIGLVLIFKSQLTSLVESIFSKIVSESQSI